MSLPVVGSGYADLAATLTPTEVSAFLAANGSWELENRISDVKEIWTRPASGTTQRARVMLPLATDYADYEERFADALRAIGLVDNWDVEEVRERIISTHSDLLFVHLDQAWPDDTIPLRQAEAAIDAIFEMVKAAAISAATPEGGERSGRLPSAVFDFLHEDVRLGHTKRGSFVFTVVTRLDRPTPESARFRRAEPQPAVFPRKVMETLARGLETTRDLTQGKTMVSVENAARCGVSADLVESLEDLIGPQERSALELSFEWAAARAKPTVGVEPIRLEHSDADELARVREQLLRQEEPAHRATLVGLVKELAREDQSLEAEDTASVVIATEVNGRKRDVHLILSGTDHKLAIESYLRRLPLIVTGELVFEHRAWRLIGDVDVDARLVERGRDDSSG